MVTPPVFACRPTAWSPALDLGRFTNLCRELEMLTSTGDSAGADGLLSEIEVEYVGFEVDLRHRPGW